MKVGGVYRFFENQQAVSNIIKNISQVATLRVAGQRKEIGTGSLNVVRLDGLYFHNFNMPIFGRFPRLYKILNDIIFHRQLIKNIRKSDCIIYQSNFSKKSFEKFMPELVCDKPSVVIYNGADQSIFHDSTGKHYFDGRLFITSVSVEYPVKRLHYIFATIQELKLLGFEVCCNLVLGKSNLKHRLISERLGVSVLCKKFGLINGQDIVIHTELTAKEISEIHKKSHIYVTFSNVDPCPNSVIEAISSGLPVVGPDTGGVSELIPTAQQFHTDVKFDEYFNWFKYSSIDEREIKRCALLIADVARNYPICKKKTLELASKFSLIDMWESYYKWIAENV
jgi:glycosyltransferase involved in cell wall biosynthesis